MAVNAFKDSSNLSIQSNLSLIQRMLDGLSSNGYEP